MEFLFLFDHCSTSLSREPQCVASLLHVCNAQIHLTRNTAVQTRTEYREFNNAWFRRIIESCIYMCVRNNFLHISRHAWICFITLEHSTVSFRCFEFFDKVSDEGYRFSFNCCPNIHTMSVCSFSAQGLCFSILCKLCFAKYITSNYITKVCSCGFQILGSVHAIRDLLTVNILWARRDTVTWGPSQNISTLEDPWEQIEAEECDFFAAFPSGTEAHRTVPSAHQHVFFQQYFHHS